MNHGHFLYTRGWKQGNKAFEIINKKGNQAYQLARPTHWKIYDVFHLSFFRESDSKEGGDAMQLTTISPDNKINIESDDQECFFKRAG